MLAVHESAINEELQTDNCHEDHRDTELNVNRIVYHHAEVYEDFPEGCDPLPVQLSNQLMN